MKSKFISRLSVLGVALFGVTAGTAAAQNRPNQDRNPEQFIERRVERLDEQLNLTDAQEDQVRGILQSRAQDMKQHFADSTADRSANRAHMRSQLEETDKAITAVLTPEQQQQYTQLKSERKARIDRAQNRDRDRRGARVGQMRGGVQAFVKELNLTDQQQDQLKQIMSEQRGQMQSWRKDHADASQEELQAFMQSHMQQLNARIEAVLTPDQVEKYHAARGQMMQNRQGHGPKGKAHQDKQQKQDAPAENEQ